ncbi:MAG TPA: NAD(+)/NADH kinase [Rectinemataceae bacterium]|nr:NAD(+)/NADH kinase [Rectinemataceae bacterium]
MDREKKRVLIVANREKDDAAAFAAEMEAYFATLGVVVSSFTFQGDPGPAPDTKGVDLVVSLGGDGTVLYSARIAAPHGVPLFPVNLGRLGFIAEIGREDWKEAFDSWLRGTLPVSERAMLSIEAVRDDEVVASYCALNDGVISAQGIAKLIDLKVTVGGSALGRYRSDGIIVATPTGSTAYNLAAGGPILQAEMEAMVFNPICPFALSNRPLILPARETIEIHVERGRRAAAMLTVDGQETLVLFPGDTVRYRLAEEKARIFASGRYAFYEVLRSKLAWSGGPDA